MACERCCWPRSRGALMSDLGVVPDDTVEARARGEQGVKRTLTSQLAEIGYSPADITYFAISHAHGDHVANANLFAASTWLARPAERAFMRQQGRSAWSSRPRRRRQALYRGRGGAVALTVARRARRNGYAS
jgi:glyoxylase-like metal-dependent hydrolase (beta-lactamase superfamily II)